MLTLTLLVVLFAVVFGFIGWRILTHAAPGNESEPDEKYVCPVCSEQNCLCELKPPPGNDAG